MSLLRIKNTVFTPTFALQKRMEDEAVENNNSYQCDHAFAEHALPFRMQHEKQDGTDASRSSRGALQI